MFKRIAPIYIKGHTVDCKNIYASIMYDFSWCKRHFVRNGIRLSKLQNQGRVVTNSKIVKRIQFKIR